MTNLGPVDAGEAVEQRLRSATQDLERLVQRLRRFSTAAWRGNRGAIEDLLDALVGLSASLEGVRDLRRPALPDYALADAVAVIGADVLASIEASRDIAGLDAFLGAVGVGLSRSR